MGGCVSVGGKGGLIPPRLLMAAGWGIRLRNPPTSEHCPGAPSCYTVRARAGGELPPASPGKTRSPQLGAEVWGPAQFPSMTWDIYKINVMQAKQTHLPATKASSRGMLPQAPPLPSRPLIPNFLSAPPERQTARSVLTGKSRRDHHDPAGCRETEVGGESYRGYRGLPSTPRATQTQSSRSRAHTWLLPERLRTISEQPPRSPLAAPNFCPLRPR